MTPSPAPEVALPPLPDMDTYPEAVRLWAVLSQWADAPDGGPIYAAVADDQIHMMMQDYARRAVAEALARNRVDAPSDAEFRALALRHDASEHGPGHLIFANVELGNFSRALLSAKPSIHPNQSRTVSLDNGVSGDSAPVGEAAEMVMLPKVPHAGILMAIDMAMYEVSAGDFDPTVQECAAVYQAVIEAGAAPSPLPTGEKQS